MDRLFIYGTLAPGKTNHNVMEEIPGDWEEASITGTLYEKGWGADSGCPGVVPSEDGNVVPGYLFSSSELVNYWAMLDDFEGVEYQRVPVRVKKVSGETVEAFVYALNESAN